jgi:hypothetical protein
MHHRGRATHDLVLLLLKVLSVVAENLHMTSSRERSARRLDSRNTGGKHSERTRKAGNGTVGRR